MQEVSCCSAFVLVLGLSSGPLNSLVVGEKVSREKKEENHESERWARLPSLGKLLLSYLTCLIMKKTSMALVRQLEIEISL